jgi:hypothetical protein
MGEDGEDQEIRIDPEAKKAFEERKAETEQSAAQVIFNPAVGRYDVMSDVGPDFATRREEAFNALSQIAAQNPELMSIIGDLVMLAADFPLADEAAERLRRMVPAQAMGDGPNPQVVELQQKLQAMQNLMASMSAKLVDRQDKDSSRQESRSVDIYKAVTDRLDTIMKYSQIPARELLKFQHDLAMQEHSSQLTLAEQANAANLAGDQDDTAEAA